MLASSQQGLQNALDQYSAASDQAAIKISTTNIEL